MSTIRYAAHGSEAFNTELHSLLRQLAADVKNRLGNNLIALILGGGYGRGEGAVWLEDGIESPYNDLDLMIVVRSKRRLRKTNLNDLCNSYAARLHIHVDIGHPLTLRDIRKWPSWLMWYDLWKGHIVLSGSENILNDNVPVSLDAPLPLIEASRLLLNRGAGLLWALRVSRGIETEPDFDFIRRNYYKCGLALGDAMLIAHQVFTTRYQGRDALLRPILSAHPISDGGALQALYEQSLHFKLSPAELPQATPDSAMLTALVRRWMEVFLYIESMRTGQRWQSLDEYCAWRGIREKELHRVHVLPRNFVRNLQRRTISLRYPREDLFRQLPKLFVDATNNACWAQRTEQFLKTWQRFN